MASLTPARLRSTFRTGVGSLEWIVLALLVAILPASPRSLEGSPAVESPRASEEVPTGFRGAFKAGDPVDDALRALQDRGASILFTEKVVRRQLRAQADPTGDHLGAILKALLEPHGLAARETSEGVFLIVSAAPSPPATGRIRGRVRDSATGAPVEGARIQIGEDRYETITDRQGRFRFPAVPRGPQTIAIEHPDYFELQETLEVEPERSHRIAIDLATRAPIHAELQVAPYPGPIVGDTLSSLSLTRDEIEELPQIAADAIRALELLPGTSSNDLSAEFSVRGGREDEVLVLIDGFEIVDPYHLPDYDNALSLFAPGTVSSATLTTGGFSPEYGDRMSGMLELTTIDPATAERGDLGASALEAHTLAARVETPKLSWFASGRHGLLPVPLEKRSAPAFWDAMGRIDYSATPRQSFRLQLLNARDDLNLNELEVEGDEIEGSLLGPLRAGSAEKIDTSYQKFHSWLSHDLLLNGRVLLRSQASWSQLDSDRKSEETLSSGGAIDQVFVNDLREVEIATLSGTWNALVRDAHDLRFGLSVRRLRAIYDYQRNADYGTAFSQIRDPLIPASIARSTQLRSTHASAYAVDGWRPHPRVSAELGLRLDRKSLPRDNDHVSPRLRLDWQFRDQDRVRFAWGIFHQTQRAYELSVEDGEPELSRSERGEHVALGYERSVSRATGSAIFRVEVYNRKTERPRIRFENLLDPLGLIPETELDRFRIEPERSLARGLEVLVTGETSRGWRWFASYDRSITEDRIDGLEVPRANDQRDTLRFHFGLPFRKNWRIDLSGELGSGTPTTPIELSAGEGTVPGSLQFGALRSERLPNYFRLDLRASRNFETRRGDIQIFFALIDLTDRSNVRGYSLESASLDGDPTDGPSPISLREETWPGQVPNAGFRWRF